MRTATVHYEDGTIITTSINGTNSEIQKHFALGKEFNIGTYPKENIQKVAALTIE